MSKDFRFKNLSEKEKDEFVNQTDIFCKWFTKQFNVPIYLMYGTLLGCVRSNNFIDNDNDVDLAYLSRYNKFADVFKEMLAINAVIENLHRILSFGQGSNLPRYCGHSHIYSEDKKYVFDVWTSWIDEKGRYNFYSMGKHLNQNILLPFRFRKLRNKSLLTPNNAEELLTYLYTEDWKKPMNRKSYYYRKDYWRPFIDIYKEKLNNKETK